MSLDPQPLSLAEFIAWEERQAVKHEFRDGAVFAMAGTTDDHNEIVSNLLALIRPTLRNGPCRTYHGDVRLIVETFGARARYPDLMVTCDKRDARDRRNKRHPKLIVEVLSDSTESVDLGEKQDEYRTIPELEEYVVVDSRRPLVRVYRRNGAFLEVEPIARAGTVTFRSIGLTIAFDDLYESTSFVRGSSETHS
jgi:Uma2 family endonuclease